MIGSAILENLAVYRSFW